MSLPDSTDLPRRRQRWIGQMEQIVGANGKVMMGWNPAIEGYAPGSTSINHYWSDYTGGAAPMIKPEWFNQGRPVIVTPEYNAYLDFGYEGSPGRTPRTEFNQAYLWDPEWVYEKYRFVWAQPTYGGPKAEDIIGVEAPIWGESVPGLPNNQYMVFPRLAGIFEIAWSPKTLTQDINAYIQRVSAAGPRFAFAEVNYGSITQITWQKSAMGAYAYLDEDHALDGTVLARMTAASEKISEYTATISWGDGSAAEPGTITGKEYAANLRQGRTAMTVAGTHTYPRDGVYMGSVTFTRAGVSTVVPFIAQANPADVPPQSDAQVITASLSGNPLRLSIGDPSPIALGAATLTGHDQIVSGTLHPATVLDPRGSNAGWSLTGQVSDFAGSGGSIILAANLGWQPNAQSVGGSLGLAPAGPASVVDPGPDLVPGNGLGTPSTLCSAAAGASAGVFHCGADLQFGIPYNANLGTYTGVLTLTLI